jgi:hypothetical protein
MTDVPLKTRERLREEALAEAKAVARQLVTARRFEEAVGVLIPLADREWTHAAAAAIVWGQPARDLARLIEALR